MRVAPHDWLGKGRGWALSSLVAGALWVVLAVAPTFITTLIGLPFGVYAFAAGLLCRRSQLRAGDRLGARWAAWGVGLACAGFGYLCLFYLVAGSLLAAGVAALLGSLLRGTPSP